MNSRRALVVGLALSVTACGIFGGGDDAVDPPMPLQEFAASLDLRRVMSANVGDAGEDLRLGLRPAGDGTRVFVANGSGDVFAFDGKSGARIWRSALKAPLSAGPGVGDGRVVVASRDGDLIALDARSGAELWRRDIDAEVLAPPAVGGERVFVRSVDGRLIAVDGGDGEQQWFVEQPVPPLTQRGTGSPVITGDTVVAGFDNGRVVAASLLSGEVLWELPLGLPTGRSDIERMIDADGAIAAVGNDLYLTGFRSRTAAVAAESGQPLWARELSSYVGLGVDWASVYVTLDNDQVLALSRETGAQLWSNEQLLRRQLTAPVSFGEYAVVGDFEGYLHFLAARTGLLSARVQVANSPIVTRPYVMGNTLYVQTASGRVSGYQIRGIEQD